MLTSIRDKGFSSAKMIVFVVFGSALSGCDDVRVMMAYAQSHIQEGAENRSFTSGDIVASSEAYSKMCLVSPLSDLNEFSNNAYEVNFSEEFYFVLMVDTDGLESVERVHSSWLVTPNGSSLCVESPDELIVKLVDGKHRLHIEVSEKG